MDRHLLLKHHFPVAVSQREETTMETAPTIPELETLSTDAITLEDQPMKDTYYINTPFFLPMALSLLPLPPLLNLTRPSPYTQLTWICNPGLLLFPLLCRLSLPCLTSLCVWKGQTHFRPRYFFWGAPSAEDDSPQARLIREAPDRAIRAGPRHYSVQFIPMTLFAVKKVESVRVEGREYSLSSYWIEEPQASLSKEVSTQNPHCPKSPLV